MQKNGGSRILITSNKHLMTETTMGDLMGPLVNFHPTPMDVAHSMCHHMHSMCHHTPMSKDPTPMTCMTMGKVTTTKGTILLVGMVALINKVALISLDRNSSGMLSSKKA